MRNPDLGRIVRRSYALVGAAMLPAGALLLRVGHASWAFGLLFGSLIALLNASMLVRRINRAADAPTLAPRIMRQGMSIRFTLIMLAVVVTIKVEPASIPGFLAGLLFAIAMSLAVATRALYQAAAEPAPGTPPAPGRGRRAALEIPLVPTDTVSALADLAPLARRGDRLLTTMVARTKRRTLE